MKLKDRFNLTSIENSKTPNVMEFICNDVKYYIGLYNFKIRKQGENKWSGKIISILSGKN